MTSNHSLKGSNILSTLTASPQIHHIHAFARKSLTISEKIHPLSSPDSKTWPTLYPTTSPAPSIFISALGTTRGQAGSVAAQREIDRQLATRALIIEDEWVIALDLKTLVAELGHEVIGVAPTHAKAVELAKGGNFGLVLADIQLADDSSGIDAVKDILAEFEVPVIFITAFPERLLTGERPEPTFLITKPFQRSTVKAAISQALFFDQSTAPAE